MGSRWTPSATAAVVGAFFLATFLLAAGLFALAAASVNRDWRPTSENLSVDANNPFGGTTAARGSLAKSVVFTPRAGANDVGLGAGVIVKTRAGRIISARVADANGAPRPGQLTTNGRTWWSTGALAPDTTYRIEATLIGRDGPIAGLVSSFHTLVPVGRVATSIFPTEGMTVGVGQPIIVRFDRPVDDPTARATVLRHLSVAASIPVHGGWHWFSPTELHFRPRSLWPAGDSVSVTSDLDGWNAGSQWWGAGAQTVNFAIGHAHVAIANLQTHLMSVSDNGRVVAVYPFSGGRDRYPTMNGTHLVLDRAPSVHMVSSTVGIPVNSPDGYDEIVYWDVRISTGGEFVHAAPWSVGSQGRANVSHGCIDLAVSDATAFYNQSMVGDIVAVGGGPRAPELGDRGVMDWDTDWSQWTPAN